jgi:hypothetical protein
MREDDAPEGLIVHARVRVTRATCTTSGSHAHSSVLDEARPAMGEDGGSLIEFEDTQFFPVDVLVVPG